MATFPNHADPACMHVQPSTPILPQVLIDGVGGACVCCQIVASSAATNELIPPGTRRLLVSLGRKEFVLYS